MKHAPLVLRLPAYAPPTPTRASAEAAVRLGYLFEEHAAAPTERAAARSGVTLKLAPGSVTLVTGPSGAGKTTILRAAAEAARALGWRAVDPSRLSPPERPAVALIPGGAEVAMRRLSDAGLAEAGCLVRRPRELSDGQRARLLLALSLEKAANTARRGRRALLIADEFAATLDRATATSMAQSLARAVRRDGRVCALLATPRDDLGRALEPEQTVQVRADGAAVVHAPSTASGTLALDDRYDIEPGALADYRALARFHYRAETPTRPARVLVGRDALSGELAGALVVVFPTLNGRWRQLAWPGVFTSRDKRRDAHRLNRSLRRIARVVVDPRHRGVGLAERLVRAYLADPCTPCTESVAAMGRFSEFFRRAGMIRYDLPVRPRDARLLDALDHAGVEPFRLATPTSAWRRAIAGAGEPFLRRELARWSRRPAREPAHVFREACRRIAAPMTAFAHGTPD